MADEEMVQHIDSEEDYRAQLLSFARDFSHMHKDLKQKNLALKKTNKELQEAMKSLEDNYYQSILTAFDVMTISNEFIGGHCRRVAYHASKIAQNLNFDDETRRKIKLASILHDVGLISLPEKSLIRIINGERVSKEESVIYLTHPSVSIRVFQSHDKFSEIAKIIRGHHERMDGTGFPDRLYGEKIPLESRLIAIADQYDSTYMLNPGFDPERLIDIVKTKVGTYLDPMLFNEFKNEILHGAPLHKIKNVNYEDLEPGMILAMPVKTKGGLKILGAGIILNNEYIQGIEKVAKYGNLCLPIKVYNS